MAWWHTAARVALYAVLSFVALRLALSLRLLLYHAFRLRRFLSDLLHPQQTLTIPKYNDTLQENPLHRKALTFLSSLPSLEDSSAPLLLSCPHDPSKLHLHISPGHPIRDSFLGAPLSWTLSPTDASLLLRLRRHDRRRVLLPYLQHVQTVADEIDLTRTELRLFIPTTQSDSTTRRWKGLPFTHPSTMDTLAMDPDLKTRVLLDLDNFLKNKNYYHRLGRVWKRSYLLHGPPGTGKSSFIAAMARHLGYDVYDLDLSCVSDGSEITELKTLLLQTGPRSVIVVEDIDRHLPALPDLLNLMDGLFSCCGEERVMVFTVRELVGKESNVDLSLLRPGRVDVHLCFPLCDFTAFKAMASSYLGLKDHKLYPAVEEIFQSGAAMSPAEIGEIMIANRGSPSRAIKTVISALQKYGSKRVGCALEGHRRKASDGGGLVVGDVCGEEERSEGNGMLGAGGAINKEIKKLYGFIRRGSRREDGGAPLLLPPPLDKHGNEISS